jgi:hypothetical protein
MDYAMTAIDTPTAAPRESVLGAGAGGPLTPPSPWSQYSGYVIYGGGVVVGAPTGGNIGGGVLNTQDLYVNGAHFTPAFYLPLTGGALTGLLTLSADPTGLLDAATKHYVDVRAFPEAPSDTFNYVRVNATWTRDPLQTDAPTDGALYARRMGAWVVATGVSTAPSDGSTYGINTGAWSNVIDAGVF